MKRLTTLPAAIAFAGAVGLSILAPALAETLGDGPYPADEVAAPIILNSDRVTQQGAVAQHADRSDVGEYDYRLPHSYGPRAFWDHFNADKNTVRSTQQGAVTDYVNPTVVADYGFWPPDSYPPEPYPYYITTNRPFETLYFGRHRTFGLVTKGGKHHAPFIHHGQKKRFVFKHKGRHFGGRHFTNRHFGNRH